LVTLRGDMLPNNEKISVAIMPKLDSSSLVFCSNERLKKLIQGKGSLIQRLKKLFKKKSNDDQDEKQM